jgi:hypothetical protein
MSSNSSSELSSIIKELDKLLSEGCKLQDDLFSGYMESFPKQLFPLKYVFDKSKIVKPWRTKVIKTLKKYFPKSHYLYQFTNPPLETKKLPDVSSESVNILYYKLEAYIEALKFIIWKLEEKENIAIRKEIANKEIMENILYQITYNDHNRIIRLNNFQLSKPNFNSENDNCFTYMYTHPNIAIDKSDLEKANGSKLKKRIADVIRDLGFTDELKKIFFNVSKDKVRFINPITKQYAKENNLPEINLSAFRRKDEKEGEKTRGK